MRKNITDITGTRSYIRIHFGEMILKVEGEMLVGGFVANRNSMRWEEPYERNMLSEREKEEIINAVRRKTENSHMIIEFE